jgi:hypothetical protein
VTCRKRKASDPTDTKMRQLAIIVLLVFVCFLTGRAQTEPSRTLSGIVLTNRDESVSGVSIAVQTGSRELATQSDGWGLFHLHVPAGSLSVKIAGKNITPRTLEIAASGQTENITIRIEYVIPPVHESVVITATGLDPTIDQRNDTVYKNTLFLRDDQLLQSLNAGINAGQHEGGGKSLEVRRFGFNLDHGGVSGGLKVLVDDVQQNQGTQGHGQGYLGQLKSLTPELVQDVNILNGPFSAQYGDFSGLGVVHIRLKESLPDQLTLRLQAGSFNSYRTFLAYSPKLKQADAFVAYEGSRTDGPFKNPLQYKRDNLTGNYTAHLSANKAIGFKLNLGRNDFLSSGQIPLDEVAADRLDRFGFIDPFNGGRVRTGVVAAYYRQEWKSGATLKLDGFIGRSLFDLYSNFTFFLNDPVKGDEIQQHDSRLQQGANAQFLIPYKLFGKQALLQVGGNLHANQINVGLSRTIQRDPFEVVTSAHAGITNYASYLQNGLDLLNGHLHIETGLRLDYFRFRIDDRVTPALSGNRSELALQPKLSLAFTPSHRLPATFYFNYGRGISSQDARGVIEEPSSPAISTTDFYQLGTSHRLKRFSLATDVFLIDHSHEQVYIPDDGSIEFKGPSRSYGYEAKMSIQLTKYLALNGGLTQVMNAFYRGTSPRIYVDSAPHTVANGGLMLSAFHGFTGSLGYRHISNYRLDGEDASIRASGLDVIDFSIKKAMRSWVDFNLSIDNLTNKRYFETQNYFESRLRPGDPVIARIHGTPGYPFGVTAGLTFRLFGKD